MKNNVECPVIEYLVPDEEGQATTHVVCPNLKYLYFTPYSAKL